MILVAYLDNVANGTIPQATFNADKNDIAGMINVSSDPDANAVYASLNKATGGGGKAAIEAVANAAGMTGFKFDNTDPLYVLGQSQITANDFARFFASINTLLPASESTYGLGLLSNITPAAGLLQAGLPAPVYSKEGWKPEPGPTNPFGQEGAEYVVNQAGQFTSGGTTYGVAVTVGGLPSAATGETDGETIIQNVVQALVETGQ
jgi:hypothetical protein